jgi:hypothetical protein
VKPVPILIGDHDGTTEPLSGMTSISVCSSCGPDLVDAPRRRRSDRTGRVEEERLRASKAPIRRAAPARRFRPATPIPRTVGARHDYPTGQLKGLAGDDLSRAGLAEAKFDGAILDNTDFVSGPVFKRKNEPFGPAHGREQVRCPR